MAAGEKVIGKLKLDTSQIDYAVKHVNEELKKLGVGVKVDLSSKVSSEVKKQLDGVLKEIEAHGKKIDAVAQKTVESIKKIGEAKITNAQTNKDTREAIKLWNEYYQIMAQAERARKSGDDSKEAYLKSEAAAVRELAKAKREEADVFEQTAKARRSYESAQLDTQYKKEQASLENLIKKYQQKYEFEERAAKALASGNVDQSSIYQNNALAIEKEIQAIAQKNDELNKSALASEKVAAAREKAENAFGKLGDKSADAEKKSVEEYTNSLLNLVKVQTEFEKAMSSGKGLSETSATYQRLQNDIANAAQKASEAGAQLTEDQRNQAAAVVQTTEAYRQYTAAVAHRADVEKDRQDTAYINQAEEAYKKLTTAINMYNIAKRSQNEERMGYWQDEVNNQFEVINGINNEISQLNVDEGVRTRIVQLTEQARTQQEGLGKETAASSSKTGELESQVQGLVTRYFSLLAVIRTIKNVLSEMVEYVSKYYDKMNEIQIITGKSSGQVKELGETYRQLAHDMSVSSLEMADAAIYFTRQGLPAAEIEKRLKNVTMYAKTANIEFERAAELTTAVVNSMGLAEQEAEDGRNAVQRVVDVFLAVGDNAATSGEEIGEAMQKAAASAGAFGVSFEWLASYIATVSETTRQEARTIGTAFNTIIARLHQIKQTGYNSEDETKINDVAKALSKVDIALMDQYGNWRDMEDIFADIAAKWGDMDDKTRSYIATTMAGVKQQNVFLALMNDMSKGIKNGSRAYELHAIAVNSAGTAEQKYAIYTDSVTAAQNRLTAAQERFYSILDAGVIKSWKNALSGILDFITRGTKSMKNMNLIIPLVIAGITLLIPLFKKLGAAIREAAQSSDGLIKTLSTKHPVMMAITIFTTLMTVMTAVGAAIGDMKERYDDATSAIAEHNGKIDSYMSLQKQMQKMFESFEDGITNEKLAEYDGLLGDLAEISPRARQAVNDLKDGVIDQAEAFKILNEEMDGTIERERKMAFDNLKKRYANADPTGLNAQFLSQWIYRAEEQNDDYSEGLKKWYENKSWDYYDFGFIRGESDPTNVAYEMVQKYVKQAESYGYGEKEKWEWVSQQVINAMFGVYDVNDAWDAMFQRINEEIDYVIDNLDPTLDDLSKRNLKKQLYDAILGGDDYLSLDEYGSMYGTIYKFLDEYQKGIIKVTDDVRMEELIKKIFPLNADVVLDVLSDDVAAMRYKPGMVDKIADAYQEVFESGILDFKRKGFSTDIGGEIFFNWITENLDNLDSWSDMVDNMKMALMNEMTDNDYYKLFYDTDANGNRTRNGQMWFDVDLKTLRIAAELIQNNVLTIEQLKSVMAEASDMDEFSEVVIQIAENAGLVGDNIEEKTIPALSDLAKSVKDAQTEIAQLDAIIEKISNGEPIKISELLDLATAHPELLSLIGDVTSLTDGLETLRKTLWMGTIGDLRDMLLTDKGTAMASPFWQDLIANDEETLYSMRDNDDVKKYVDKLIVATLFNTGLLDDFASIAMDEDDVLYESAIELRDELINSLRSKYGEFFMRGLDEVIDDEYIPGEDWLANMTFEALQLMNALKENGVTASEFDEMWKESGNDVNQFVEIMKHAGEETAKTTEKTIDYDKVIKDTISNFDKLAKILGNVQDGGTISLSDMLELSKLHPELMMFIGDADAFIAKLKEIRNETAKGLVGDIKNSILNEESFADMFTHQTGITYGAGVTTIQGMRDIALENEDAETLAMIDRWTESMAIAMLASSDKFSDVGKEMVGEWIQTIEDELASVENWDENSQQYQFLINLLEILRNAYYEVAEAEQTWLDKQVEQAELNERNNWAANNNYIEEIGFISRGLGHVEGEADGEPGLQDALQNWNSLDEALQKSIAETYPGLARAINNADKVLKDASSTTEDYEKAAEDLNNELQKSRKYATVTHFTGTYAAIQKLEKGTISATDAYEEFNKELDQVVKAGEDITAVEEKMADGTEITTSDVSDLAKVLNMSADEILQDWPSAVRMFDELTGASGELQAAFDALNAAAFIKITGVSEADFSNLENGLFAVRESAQELIDLLVATGQWEVVSVDLPQDAKVWDPYSKTWSNFQAMGGATVLKPTNNNPYKGRSKSKIDSGTKESDKKSGGGGGGGGNKNEMTEVERQLDRYSQVNAIQEYQRSWYQAQKNYYSQTGQLQGVIGYSQREIDLLKEQNKVLESNIDWIEEHIDTKQAELNALSTSDDKYEEVADDLDKLQQEHQKYTKQLIANKTSIDQLTQAIDEQHKKIREMEINLRNTILKAIQDREKRTKDMLNAEIEMENKILDLITKRYEKERDQIIENTNLKIDSLKRESEMLDEQLRKRKELEEAEDKQKKLLELEEKYQRILADPTRLKEAKDIKQEIDDLRKEMAWDLAEEEVEAQKESIEQQTDSLEDYIEYVQNYYDDLFEHPQKLIDEMKGIMLMTDEEIINWLITNDEEFAKSTENTQRTMIESWQETLDTMHDIVKTYWEEVEYIISQGDDYILTFLKENMSDYREAGKLQAEAYVDEWKKQLDDLKKAYQEVQTQAASSYSTIEKSSGSGKSGGGGGGGGGGSGNKHGYSFQYNGTKYSSDSEESKESAETIAKNLIESLGKQERDKAGTDFPNGGTQYEYAYNQANKHYKDALKGLTTYGRGGLANFTGPAWLDGTANLPERVLSPYQTELFETMVQALEQISRIAIPGMPYFGENFSGGGSNAVSVGDIIVNVDNLDTDADYEELAEKVGAVLMEQIGQTAVIGGLRIRSV